MRKHTQGGKRFGGTLAALLGAALASACVSQEQYDEAVALAKQYQTEVYELQDELTKAKDANAKLEAAVREGTYSALEGDITRDAEARLNNLQALLDDLGRPIQDIERFDVEGGYLFMIQDRLLFESGRAELGSEGRDALREISREIAASPHGTLLVRGHTDSDPVKKPETLQRFPHGNIQLSAERAVAVAALLIEAGDITEDNIRVMGFGPHEPVVPNDSPENKRLNRRVEIFVENPSK